jgi:hypothetical protein
MNDHPTGSIEFGSAQTEAEAMTEHLATAHELKGLPNSALRLHAVKLHEVDHTCHQGMLNHSHR